jgi:putative nucleotidyltransferase with HDIG domain
MSASKILYLVPYLGSLGLSLGIFIFAWLKSNTPGTRAYLWYIGGQTLYVFGFIMGMISRTLGEKIFWEDFQYMAGQLIVIAFIIFAIEYTDYKIYNTTLIFKLSLIFPAIFTALLATDHLHHLIYSHPYLQPVSIFSKLDYENTAFIFVYAVYSYLILSLGFTLLLRRLMHPLGLYRSQIAILIVGFFIPILGTVLILTGVWPSTRHDPTAATTAISNVIIVWGLYRFRLFKITPIGRDKVFEAMVEPVVILNNKNLIVDINSAMLDLLNKPASAVLGEPAREIFDNFPIPIKLYAHVSYARAVATFQIAGKDIFYELTVWPLFNSNKEMTGRIYISHDITAMKELEQELRDLNVDLEKRVRARTSELAEAYDTTLEGWARALELRDEETEGHSRRVTETTIKIAKALELSDESLEHIRRGALLHDIGKMSIPDDILHKPGKLTPEERVIVQEHPTTAYKLLSPIPFLKEALEIPYSHHEKWDGTGYPQGLREREIPLSARIFAVADVWDAICSERPYNSAWPRDKAIKYLLEQSGTHFDPRIVDIFLDLVEKGEI